jgi:hypothetical protein
VTEKKRVRGQVHLDVMELLVVFGLFANLSALIISARTLPEKSLLEENFTEDNCKCISHLSAERAV